MCMYLQHRLGGRQLFTLIDLHVHLLVHNNSDITVTSHCPLLPTHQYSHTFIHVHAHMLIPIHPYASTLKHSRRPMPVTGLPLILFTMRWSRAATRGPSSDRFSLKAESMSAPHILAKEGREGGREGERVDEYKALALYTCTQVRRQRSGQ